MYLSGRPQLVDMGAATWVSQWRSWMVTLFSFPVAVESPTAGSLRSLPDSMQSEGIRLAVLGEVASAPGAGGPGRRLEYERVGPAGEAMVPISQIVGTVEPTRCFDRQFRATSDHVWARFQRIAVEVRSGRGMDPVELYRCSGSYYVLDGRHRIAVARALGQRSVWALVTEVRLNNPAPACPAPRPPESTWALS